ncbi:MAG: RNA methyltransferase [Cyclobacteriaceae bacterium]|jgi:tRNA (guanosine-2'-O-)-methyltransferase|nr:RNA methyltransferase [Cyclobacteriaceae bacterium]
MTEAEKNQRLTAFFQQYVTDHKRDFMERVLAQRTRHVTVVLEDIVQSQNASAVVRTCECLGLQDIHIVENYSKYGTNKKVLKGSHHWVNLIRHKGRGRDNTRACFQHLKEKGYQIVVTDPAPDGLSIFDVPVDKPVALVMGNEWKGISDSARAYTDQKVHIPMAGFTESLNISVSSAICLSTLLNKLRQSSGIAWQLPDEEKEVIRLAWLRNVVRRSDLLEREFLKSIA